jgi:hypothetical protein
MIGATLSASTTDAVGDMIATGNIIEDIYHSGIDSYDSSSTTGEQETHGLDLRAIGNTIIANDNIIKNCASVARITDNEGVMFRAKKLIAKNNTLVDAGSDEAAMAAKWSFDDGVLFEDNHIGWGDESTLTTRTGYLVTSQTGEVLIKGGSIRNAVRCASIRSKNTTVSGVDVQGASETAWFLAPDEQATVESLKLLGNTYSDVRNILEHARFSSNGRADFAVELLVVDDESVDTVTSTLYQVPQTTKASLSIKKILNPSAGIFAFNLYDGDALLDASKIMIHGIKTQDFNGGRIINTSAGISGFSTVKLTLRDLHVENASYIANIYNRDFLSVNTINCTDVGTTTNAYNVGTQAITHYNKVSIP